MSARRGWALGQFLLGMAALFSAQVWGLALVAQREEKIGLWDLLMLSGRLWAALFRRLPESRWPIWLASWGLVLLAGDALMLKDVAQEFRRAVANLKRRAPDVRSVPPLRLRGCLRGILAANFPKVYSKRFAQKPGGRCALGRAGFAI